MSSVPNSSYGRILKTSALLGGSSMIGLALGIVRTKVLAVQLGPGLFGTMGLYGSLLGMVTMIANLGLGQSAVREIAAAAAKNDAEAIAHTVKAFRRVVWITGLLGMTLMLALAWPGSYWTFGDSNHAWAFAALSLTVLAGHLAMGQVALLQGLRRIRDMTALGIMGAVFATALSIPILLVLRDRGIVPFMLAVSVGTLLMGWWYVRRVEIAPVRQSWRETWSRSRNMIALGITFMAAGLVVVISDYLVRLILVRNIGEAGVGLYQAAFTLSGTGVGFVLGAMGADYFPRLTGAIHDREKANLLINEQADVAIILGVPGLIAALLLAEWVIWGFYSSAFNGAAEILRWMVLGLFGRLVAWPIGFIMQARADKKAFFWSELVTFSLHVVLVAVLVKRFGAAGSGMAFAGMYFWYVPLIVIVSRWRYGFAWRAETLSLVACGSALMLVAFIASYIPSPAWRYGCGGVILLAACAMSAASMYRRLGREQIAETVHKVRGRLGLAAA